MYSVQSETANSQKKRLGDYTILQYYDWIEGLLDLISEYLVFEYSYYADDAEYANEVCIKKVSQQGQSFPPNSADVHLFLHSQWSPHLFYGSNLKRHSYRSYRGT